LDTAVAVADYVKAFGAFTEIADYITVNISCPNAQGGMPFLEPAKLDLLFSRLDAIQTDKSIFVKMSPDKTVAEVDKILDTLKKHRVHGIICSNLTKKTENPKVFEKNIPQVGGISGKPVQDLSDDLLAHIYRREGKRFILIGCGGIFSAEDAYKKIRLGASLVELITGMIFKGPQLISDINLGLTELLRRDGFQNISEAVGADYK
jgi:dihydroorotate dehydrogenase